MTARVLPGFHYDAAKRKYFRIQPNHVAPANSKYSQQAVQRAAQQETWKKPNLNTKQTRRSRIFRHPLGGGFGLQREIDIRMLGRPCESRYAAWAQGLHQKQHFSRDITKFSYDNAYDILHRSYGPRMHGPAVLSDIEDRVQEHSMLLRGTHTQSEIVSIDLSPARVLMIMTIGTSCPGNSSVNNVANIYMTRLCEPGLSLDFSNDFWLRDELPIYDDVRVNLSVPGKTFWVSSFSLHD